MTARFLAWYSCIVFALGCVASTAITVAPGHEWLIAVLMLAKASAAVLFWFLATTLSRLPPEHWGNRSLVVRAVLLVVALIATLFLAG